jgi:hypothetical protein
MQRLYRRHLRAYSLYADYSTLDIRITVGTGSEKLDFQICVDLEFPRIFTIKKEHKYGRTNGDWSVP